MTPSTIRWRSPNDQAETWDYFVFNDRDFTSVAELMLVPGCPPGLFTKQFVELAPMPPSTTAPRSATRSRFPSHAANRAATPTAVPDAGGTSPRRPPTPPSAFSRSGEGSVSPAAHLPVPRGRVLLLWLWRAGAHRDAADPGSLVDGPGGDGWFKMFEFFEVPSQSIGAIGPVAERGELRLGPAGHSGQGS